MTPPITVNAAFVNRYLTYMRDTLRRSPATIHTRHRHYAHLLTYLGSKPFAEVTHTDLQEFCQRPRRGRDLAADATVAADVASLRVLFRYLHEIEEVIQRNPAVKLVAPTVHNDIPHPVPADVWKEVWFSRLSDSDRVGFGLAYFCGFRRFEVVGLRPDQFVDVPYPIVSGVIRKGRRKGAPGFRYRSCLDLYAARLGELIGDPDEMFVQPLTRLRQQRVGAPALLTWAETAYKRTAPRKHPLPYEGFVTPDLFNKRLNAVTRRLGLPHVAPHDLRHSFCTNLCSPAARVPVEVVSKLAGHSDVRITMRYVDIGSDPLGDLLNVAVDAEVLAPITRWG